MGVGMGLQDSAPAAQFQEEKLSRKKKKGTKNLATGSGGGAPLRRNHGNDHAHAPASQREHVNADWLSSKDRDAMREASPPSS